MGIHGIPHFHAQTDPHTLDSSSMASCLLGPPARLRHELPLKVKHGVPVRSPRLPLNYGAALYDPAELPDTSPSSARMKSEVKKTGTLHDVKLRSWLERRRKAVEGTRLGFKGNGDVAVYGQICHCSAQSNAMNALHLPFKWVPIQAREMASDEVYFRGVHVNSLSPVLKPGLDADWKPMEVKSRLCQPGIGGIHCCIVGAKMVFCRGLLQCFEAKPAGIIQLPANMRPSGTLRFAVLCSEALDQGSRDGRLSLGRMKVTREGWLCIESVSAGIIDLSGIRFAVGGGLPLSESVQVFSCSLGSQNLVMLQGRVSEQFFETSSGDPLVQLPPDFRPPEKCPFVVPGGRTGGFHLLHIAPSSSGGQLEWSDSVWNRDDIELTGVTYETDATLDCLPGSLINSWSSARRQIVLGDFQKFITSKFGSLESAWQAYNVYGDGQVDFTDFIEGCKLAKFSGNLIRLWSMLDIQNQGVITFQEFIGK
eukprot:s6204_g2.t1